MEEITKMKTVFMGTSVFSEKILDALVRAGYNISAVYTQPARKSGRDGQKKNSAVKESAEKLGISVLEPEKFDEEAVGQLKSFNPELIIVVAYGRILPEEILNIPRYGCLNVHASLLPKLRGPSPIQNAILLGERETGITIMLMDRGVDTGEIVAQRKVEIEEDETYPELSHEMSITAASLLLETIPLWIGEKITPVKQDESEATMCSLIERSDGKIFWNEDARVIYNKYRAFTPWPGIFTFWEKDGRNFRLILDNISFMETSPENASHPGEVFKVGEKVGVRAENGAIILDRVQMEGKNSQGVKEFVNGYPDFIGSILK